MHEALALTPLLVIAAYVLCLAVWFAESGRKNPIFAELWRRFRTLTVSGKLVAVVLLSSFIVYGSTKTNSPAPPPAPPVPPPGASSGIVTNGFLIGGGGLLILESGGEPPAPPRLTTNQCLAGFALVKSLTNAASWLAVPSNAVVYSRWTRYGVAEDTFYLPATNWSFRLAGSNAVAGAHVSSSGTISFDDRPKGSPRARALPDGSGLDFLAPLQTAIGIVPPGGRFWHASTLSNTLLLTWQDVFAARDTNYPVTFQSELFANGDFTFRYDLSRLPTAGCQLPLTNFSVGAQHHGGGETYAHDDTNKLVDGLELRWRAFGILDPDVDDHDGDGLSSYYEVMTLGSLPALPDSDYDGLTDPQEIAAGSGPLNRDTDGDGIPDGSDPTPLVPDGADNDGDALPDAWEIYRFGATNVVDDPAADANANGFVNLADMLAGSDPAFAVQAVTSSDGVQHFSWNALAGAVNYTVTVSHDGTTLWSRVTADCAIAADNNFDLADCLVSVVSSGGVSRACSTSFHPPASANLTVWKIADPFAAAPPPGGTSLYTRVFQIDRDYGWQQYFISSSPDGAGAWSLDGIVLSWQDSGGASGAATASPAGDSLRLELGENSPATLTVSLTATTANALALSSRPLYLIAWSPAVAASGGTPIETATGSMLAVVTERDNAVSSVGFTIQSDGRPCYAPPSAAERAALAKPFGPDSPANFVGQYDSEGNLTGGTVLLGAPGVYPLSGVSGEEAPPSDGGGMLAMLDAGPSCPTAIALLGPGVVTEMSHWSCDCDKDEDNYPFDSSCLRESWKFSGGCVWTGGGIKVTLGDETLEGIFTVIINDIEGDTYFWRDGETEAEVRIVCGGAVLWTTTVYRQVQGERGGCSYDTCDNCGDCADGQCDNLEGDSLGSLRFRVPLGYTGEKRFAG
ncbi:MAG: hypothetical protein PHQ53_13530, partial [Candidatus Krumholzibacteria bacterium]|nr:hypothetical protein [Candidatus Krumholzibacteria bacterium]